MMSGHESDICYKKKLGQPIPQNIETQIRYMLQEKGSQGCVVHEVWTQFDIMLQERSFQRRSSQNIAAFYTRFEMHVMKKRFSTQLHCQ